MNAARIFLLYSFCGFLLEKLFAWVTGHPKKDRKCLLLLPLCPVYGLGALAILALAGPDPRPLRALAAGLLGGTAAELSAGLFCRLVLRVEFWSYRGVRGNLGGLICPVFSLGWALLAPVLICGAQPLAARLLSAVPPALEPPLMILAAADLLVSATALRRTGTTEVLRWWRP